VSEPLGNFVCEPSPDHPGWNRWSIDIDGLFQSAALGEMLVRGEGPTSARLRMFPETRHANLLGTVHGGVTLALMDIALFSTFRVLLGSGAPGAMTLDLSSQFLASARLGEPLDAVTEVLRETGRLVFMRGLIEQGEARVAAYSATIRKPS